MIFTLPDGRTLDTDSIKQVSSIRDLGQDAKSIDRCILSFSVYLKDGPTITVSDYYHYADWAEVKKRLSTLRKNLADLIIKEPAQSK